MVPVGAELLLLPSAHGKTDASPSEALDQTPEDKALISTESAALLELTG